jgi:hypothetical protein
MLNEMLGHSCPVCGFPRLHEEPYSHAHEASFEICPCCGTEFGYTDSASSHDQLRANWKAAGMPWRSSVVEPPDGWDPVTQLLDAALD